MGSSGWAQSSPSSRSAENVDRAKARKLAEEGRKAYEAGEFERAEGLIRSAYALDAAPILVYNLARILDAKGDVPGALQSYRQYLELDPDTTARARVERRMEVLDEITKAQSARVTPAVAPPPPAVTLKAEPRGLSVRKVLPWVLVGTGVVALGTGGVLGFLAQDKENQARDEPVQQTAADVLSSGETLATAANALYVTGGVLVVGGIIWAWVDGDSEPAPVGLMVVPGSVFAVGRF